MQYNKWPGVLQVRQLKKVRKAKTFEITDEKEFFKPCLSPYRQKAPPSSQAYLTVLQSFWPINIW